MKNDTSSEIRFNRIGFYMAALMLAWTLAVATSVFFNFDQHRQAFFAEMHSQAKTIHIMEMGFRNWVIGHGGVYVPVDKETPPSQYLKGIPERDIHTESGRQLTLLNSSYVMRQINEQMEQDKTPLHGHITSLNPINPSNKADSWEITALQAFEEGKQEVTGIEEKADGKRYYRFMQPMLVEASCLKCHAHQGYKVGDIRGGVSVSIPVDELITIENLEIRTLLAGHGGIWLLGIAGIFFGGRRQQKTLLSAKKSEAEVRLLTDSIAHAIYGQNLKGQCTFANAACVNLLGYEHESDLLGKDMHELIHYRRPDGTDYPESECPTHRSILEGRSFHIDEEVLWRKDGSSFPASYWSYPIKHKGMTVGAVTTFLDITEQKRMGEALRQSEKLLDSIVEYIPAMVFLKDAKELRFERFNQAGEKLLGYSRAQLLGKNDFDFFSPEQAEFFTTKDRSVLDSHEVQEIEEEPIQTADGKEKWLHTFKVGIYDEQNKPSYLLGVSIDITEQKQVNESLITSQYYLAEAQRIAHIGSWQLDLVNNDLSWSDEIYRIFEMDPQQFGGSYEAFLDAIHPEDRERVNKAFSNALINPQPYQIEHRLLMADGRIKYILERIEFKCDENGQPIYSSGTTQDITDLKQAEIHVEHANRALHALSIVNRELVHATEEEALLQAICLAVVEQRGYRMAWVGYAQYDHEKSIRKMASAGDYADILDCVQPSWSEDSNGEGPSGQAVRSGQTQVVNDIAQEAHYPDWKEELIQHGCVSSVALPLKINHQVFGILHVYADVVNAFKKDEVNLLEEMADDLAFGVKTLRIRSERDKAMAQNEHHLEQMHDSLAGTVDAIARAVEARDPYTAGHQRRVASLACAIAKRMGLDDDQIEGIHMGATIHDIGKIQVPAELLVKPSKLTEIEYMMIQNHAQVGYDILKDWSVNTFSYLDFSL